MKKINCKNCQKSHLVQKLGKSGNYCSRECFYKYARKDKHPHYSHGFTKTKFYYTWVNIQNRCLRPSVEKYKRYGARGIKLIWKNFGEFQKDMHVSYLEHCKKFGEKNTFIERINNDGNYDKENCRWATREEQMRNTSRNNFIEYKGEEKTLVEWVEKLNLDYQLVWGRMKHGWNFEEAILTPKRTW